jgi:glycine/D-amino acid oxidase-like deaminating enzyme
MAVTDSQADVVIIGGGIAGCASAYYLSSRGLKVTLVDKGEVGYEQSTRNWGWVHQQVRYPHLIPLAMRSVVLWQGLEAQLDTALQWRQGGNVSLAYDAESMAELEAVAAQARTAGLETSLLSRDEIGALLTGATGGFVGGLCVPTDGQASPQLVTAGFARAARENGVTVRENCAAHSIGVANGRVRDVNTEGGTIRADKVLVAAGAWTARLLRPLQAQLPQRSVRATVVRTQPLPFRTAMTGWGDRFTFRQDALGRFILAGGMSAVFDVDLDALRHFRHFAPVAWRNRHWIKVRAGRRLLKDALALVPGSSERREFWKRRRAIDPLPSPGVAAHTIGQLRRMFPDLPTIDVESSWAGYIDSTPDQAPAIGPVPGIVGLHVLTGLSGHGFALGPAAAEMQADLLTDTEPSVSARPFRFERFAEGDLAKVRTARR